MNKIFLIILFLIILLSPQQAFSAENNVEEPSAMEEIQLELSAQEDIDLETNSTAKKKLRELKPIDHSFTSTSKELEGNLESEFSFFSRFDLDRNNDSKIDENTLLGKIIARDIIRTDVPQYLLNKELAFHPEKGPVSKIQYYVAYNGSVNMDWKADDYDTTYSYNFFQLGAIGKFRNTNTDFKVVVNPRGVHGRTYMQNFVADAYLVNNSIPHHKVLVGYSRNQVGKEGGSGSYTLPFIMRSQISRNFGSTRALGVRLIGSYDLVDYNLAFNSSDRYFRKWFAGPEFTGWVDFKPFGKTDGRYGKLIVGGGLNAGKNGHVDYTVGSAYLGYKYKRLWSSFEYAIADGYNGSYAVDKKATGFYGTVGYKIHPRLQLIGRFDQFDPNRDVSGNLKREYSAGINWFIKGQALRLILNYIYCQNQNTADSHRIMVGTQVLL